ncbi:MAG: hypothetical protein ACTSUE_13335 [Promethearchaeota archaeon]
MRNKRAFGSQELEAGEIDALKEKVQAKVWRNVTLVGVGVFLMSIALVGISTGIDRIIFGDVIIRWESESGPVEFYFTWGIDLIVGMAGAIIIAFGLNLTATRMRHNNFIPKIVRGEREPVMVKKRIVSINWMRLACGLALLSCGLWNFLIHGIGIGTDAITGEVLFHGGPSYFIVYGVFPCILGISLSINGISNNFIGHISRTTNFLNFYEHRGIITRFTEIPLRDISRIWLKSNHSGPKPTWFLVIMPYAILCLQQGFTLLVTPNNPSDAPIAASFTGIVSGTVATIVAILLVVFPQMHVKIDTKDLVLETWFFPLSWSRRNIVAISSALGFLNQPSETARDPPVQVEGREVPPPSPSSVSPSNNNILKESREIRTGGKYFLNLVVSVVFLCTGWFNLAFLDASFTMWSAFVNWVLVLLGIIGLIQSFQDDFSKGTISIMENERGEHGVQIKKEFLKMHEFYRIDGPKEKAIAFMAKRLDFFSIFLNTLLWIGITYHLTILWSLHQDGFLLLNIGYSFIGVSLSGLSFFALIHPRASFKVIDKDGKAFHVPLGNHPYLHGMFHAPSDATSKNRDERIKLKDLIHQYPSYRRAIITRLISFLIILGTSVVGTLIYWYFSLLS